MQYSSIFLAAASLALAQAKIGFTTLPSSVTAGKAVTLKWTGGDDSQPVTITLKKGESRDLKTVAVLTGNAEGNSYTWTPEKSLANGDDYALQISQGVDDVNYTGEFSLSGGGSGSSSSASSSASKSASGYPTSSVSATTTKETTVIAVNSTTSRSHTVFITGTAPASASGTGINVSRNTTFSSATPTRSHSGGLEASTTSESSSASDTAGSTTSAAPSSASSGAASHMEIQIGAGIAAIVGLAAFL